MPRLAAEPLSQQQQPAVKLQRKQNTEAIDLKKTFPGDPFIATLTQDSVDIIEYFGLDAAAKLDAYTQDLRAILKAEGISETFLSGEKNAAIAAVLDKNLLTHSQFLRALSSESLSLVEKHGANTWVMLNSAATRLEDYLLQWLQMQPNEAKDRIRQALAKALPIRESTSKSTITEKEVRDIIDEAKRFESVGSYEAAIKSLERLLESIRAYGQSSAPVLIRIGDIRNKQQLFAQAEHAYWQALELYKEMPKRDNQDIANTLARIAAVLAKQGNYEKAKEFYQRSLAIQEKELGQNDPRIAATLANLAGINDDQGNYAKSEQFYQRALVIREKVFGPEHPIIASTLANLAVLYINIGAHEKAESLLTRSLLIQKKAFGVDHKSVGITISNLALVNSSKGLYAKAESLYRQSLSILERALGDSHPDIATVFNNLALLYSSKASYSNAEFYFQRSLEIRQRLLGANHPDTGISLNNLGLLYSNQGLYSKAELFLRKSLVVQESSLGLNHPSVATILSNLSLLCSSQGLYAQAELFGLRALSIQKQALGSSHPSVAISLNNLAVLYGKQGLYVKAEPLLRQALAIQESSLGPNHPDAARSIHNLADLYSSRGLYAKAQQLYLRSLTIREAKLGSAHPDVAESLGSLALLYVYGGLSNKAESLFRRALEIQEKALGADHPAVAATLNNLAVVYDAADNQEKAIPLLRSSLKIREKALGSAHPDVAISLNNLALVYSNRNDYSKAEDYYKASLAIRERLPGGHPDTTRVLNNIAVLYRLKEQPEKTALLLGRSLGLESLWLASQIYRLPVTERYALVSSRDASLDLLFSLADSVPSSVPLALRARLNRQGLLAEIEQHQMLLAREVGRQNQYKLEKLQALTRDLASVALKPESSISIREQRDQLQAELYRELPNLSIQQVAVADVAKALPPDGVLVEFQRYRPFDGKQPRGKRWGEPRYLALILKPDGSIAAVQLGIAQPIDAAIQKALAATAANASDATQLWGQVSQLVLAPLKGQLAGSRQWFLSPDGELNRVPFAALPSPLQADQPLADVVQLRLLTTGRELVRLQQPAKASQKPVVMANPSYDRAQAQNRPVLTASVSADRPQQRSSALGDNRWAPLPATEQEGRQVAALLGTTAITGPQATTAALQQRQGPRVLHVATHGFFAADQERPPSDPLRFVQDDNRMLQGFRGEDPQLRSGLVLAGANQPEADPSDDGYLTAAEAVALPLNGTELVVLSACSTAQGEVRNGEGVYGLQRSLTVAGARSTLLSLWKVDDVATAEFMTRFYKRLKAGEGRSDALAATQKEFRDGIPGKPEWKDIYYWGAWQLVGDWRPIKNL